MGRRRPPPRHRHLPVGRHGQLPPQAAGARGRRPHAAPEGAGGAAVPRVRGLQAALPDRGHHDLRLDRVQRADPRRLRALCQVPLQDTDAACKILSRAMQDGHVGVQIGNHVGERNLDDEGLIAFLQHAASEGAAVLVHPWDMLARERTNKYMMAWTVGMPAETQLGIVSMILGGAFDQLPDSLRLCFAHGGGSFAFLLGRLDNAWRRRDIARGKSKNVPSSYLSRFYVDSAVFDGPALRFLTDVMGEDRVMLGSDYPFPLGEEFVGELIRTADGFSDSARSKLLGGNAQKFLNITDS
ncbi:MAG: amidohydrolase [Proteobacteria bacterium]|nr:amidohydrolase [Pseudomonadota bacterium]